MMRHVDNRPAIWRSLPAGTDYDAAMLEMASAQATIIAGTGREQVWTLESPEGLSMGGRAQFDDVVPQRGSLPIASDQVRSHAGGWFYHGPGVVGLVLLLDLRQRQRSVPRFNRAVHEWIVGALRLLGLDAGTRDDCLGVWVGDDKVATVAVNLKQWVSSYGGAVLLDPDMARFAQIRACAGTTPLVSSWKSLAQLGSMATRDQLDEALRESFHRIFGFTSRAK